MINIFDSRDGKAKSGVDLVIDYGTIHSGVLHVEKKSEPKVAGNRRLLGYNAQ
jgi:hypothetical protein